MLIADDQQVVRGGLVLLIGMLDGIEVVGAARDGAEAVELTERLRPDVVLDLNMPVLDGVAATAALREKVPGSAVLPPARPRCSPSSPTVCPTPRSAPGSSSARPP
ncbi:response regulator [Streptomyces antimycoticus]|uniref:response regulator n=1 Tax=Streptomyces antimycoticus TaxID=68175 RepID=UPI003F4E1957